MRRAGDECFTRWRVVRGKARVAKSSPHERRCPTPAPRIFPPRRRAVITGIGPITACGIGREAFWNAIREGRSGIAPVTFFDASIFQPAMPAKCATGIPPPFFPPHRLKRLDRYAQFAVACALLALEDARLPWRRETADRARRRELRHRARRHLRTPRPSTSAF